MSENQITKKSDFDMALLPVIQNLAALGKSEADIGMIIGYTGRKPGKFIAKLKKEYPDVAIALEVGKKLADIELVTTAMEIALGYDYMEVTRDYKYVDVKDEETGEIIGREKVLIKEKKSDKYQRPDTAMLRMLLLSRLPDYFVESKKVTLSKLIDGDPTEEEIRRFAGRLYDAVNELSRKKIVSTEVIDSE